MKPMTRRNLVLLFLVCLIVLGVQIVLAQDAQTCIPLIDQHLQAIGQDCSALGADTACYGSDVVNATFADSSLAGQFSQPGDRVSVDQLQSLQTAVLDPTLKQWGLAVMNVQADVPMAHEGQALTFVLLGDVTVDNLVSPDSALKMVEPIQAHTMVQANVRDTPSLKSNVIASAPVGSDMQVDALSADQQWVRVMYRGQVAWVSRNLVASDASLAGLPVIGSSSQSVMQDFTFHTGTGLAACDGALPALLLVQGPQNIPVTITANGAEIRISSTIVMWITPDNELRVMVLSGGARIGNLSLPPGFTTKAKLSADGSSIDGPWQNVRPMTPDERAVLQGLQHLPEGVMSYAVNIPTADDVQQTLVALASAAGGARAGAASGKADCSRFKPTSPLGGMAFGTQTFYWDGAQGANNYKLNIYNESGAQVGSFATNSDNTALTIDTSASTIGEGFSFSWEVEAYVDNALACTTAQVPVLRASGAQLAGSGGGGSNPSNPGSGGGKWGS